VESIEVDEVTLTGALRCRSAALAARLRSAGARSVAVVAVTAGRALDDETARLWAADRPDLAFCLDRLGAAVVEHLVRWTAAAVCRRAAGTEGLTALPPLAPGCSGWALSDQAMLFGLFEARESPLRMLDSGMLHPKNSMLAVVGLAAHWPDSPYLAACRACELTPCAYRRVPFDRAREGVWLEAGEGSA
jgi:hypothetical protein